MASMWEYELPCGPFRTEVFKDPKGQWVFRPPVYEQRYMTVVCILQDPRWKDEFKKIVDFGCAEMSLLSLLRNIKGLQHILEVDVDENILCANKYRAAPIVMDWLNQRDHPLRIEVLRGSITAPVECLRDTDVVLGVEILEHLCAEELAQVPENVFGFIQPRLAIFTTPNSEANVLFDKLLPNGFRHFDHKFEWTREEFQAWGSDVCQQYPNYCVTFLGAGLLPKGYQHLGHVSQIAVFARKDLIDQPLEQHLNTQLPATSNPDLQYKEIYAIDFPYRIDERSWEEKVRDEIDYQIERMRHLSNYLDEEQEICRIPLAELVFHTTSLGCDLKQLHTFLLENDYNIEDNFLIVPKPSDEFSDDSQNEDYYTDEQNEDELVSNQGDFETNEHNWD